MFDKVGFIDPLSKYQDAMPNVMKPEQVKTLTRFAELAQSLSMEASPYSATVGKTALSGVTRYGESAVQQAGELGIAKAVQTVNPTNMAFNVAQNGLTWFAKKNAIDRIMLDQEAAAIILTDPKLSAMVTERMAATVDDLKHGDSRS